MILSTLTRIAAVILAFALAALTAIIVLFAIGTYWAAGEIATHSDGQLVPPGAPEEFVLRGVGFIAFVATVAPTLTLLPGLAVVILGEVARLRAALYYIVAGGLSMIVLPVLSMPPEVPLGTLPSAQYIGIYATAGFAAGLVYWLIAGRNA
jgi:hypothetical protein